MASLPKPKPSNSRWGFLSQAVASVESKLDTILADDEDTVKQPIVVAPSTKESVTVSRSSQESARNSATSQSNDRLQERLARAMAKKAAARPETPTIPSEPISRSSTPAMEEADLQRHSIETTKDETVVEAVTDPMTKLVAPGLDESPDKMKINDDAGIAETGGFSGIEHLETAQPPETQGEPVPKPPQESVAASNDVPAVQSSSVAPSQPEIQTYIERIDALNVKLQYLSQEAIQSARENAASAENGELARKLAAKDEKIASLMQEGNKLSIAEMKNLSIIKKLRAQNAALIKEQSSTQARFVNIEQQLSLATERAKKSEDEAKRIRDQMNSLAKSDKDTQSALKERDALQGTVAELRAQVGHANARAERAEAIAQDDKIGLANLRISELETEIANAKTALAQAELKSSQQIEELSKSLSQEKEASRLMESEMLAEQAMLEGRLESFKTKAEEASSADDRDAHARLMRQIEILQGQYATASQNWQGIEGSLLARITTLERDRDETAMRENDARKKLREVTLKCKTTERELEELQGSVSLPVDPTPLMNPEIKRLTEKIQQLEQDVVSAHKDVDAQKVRLERDFARRLDEERIRLAPPVQPTKLEFPVPSSRKTSMYAGDQLMSPSHASMSRRSSALPSNMSDATRHYSMSVKGLANGTNVETPSILSPDDDYFDDLPATPVSQDRQPTRRGLNDVMSTSTVGGGLSVQLVERMSANVRRLESEKAASKDEITRITSQRDEARQEVVKLMRDVEQKTKNDSRLKDLEVQYADLSTRHQTTLEILGEKSEQVEELKQDIADVKQMYRDLADHMK